EAEKAEEAESTGETQEAEEASAAEVSEDAGETSFETVSKETILDRIENPDENLSVQEFTECITACAGLKGYRVEETAYMTIAVLAEEMQQQNTPLSLNNARKMAEDAISRIRKRNPLDKIVDKYSKKHAYILKDRHFYWNEEKD
ncbi:MAG: hypothetical protein Q4F21_15305, partial [Lachnospiraceae bacterium]|nr:hypothetical protein [Lachnospiraceae bacterium]